MSENNLPAIGTYKARRYDKIKIGLAKNGSGNLCATFPSELIGSNPENFRFEHTIVLYKADGSRHDGNMKSVLDSFPQWTVNEIGELDPYDLENIELNEDGKPEYVLADCYHKEGNNGRVFFNAQWLNPLSKAKATDPEEKAKVKALFREKFKLAAALVKTPATKPTPAPAVVAEVVEEKPAEVKSAPKRAAKAAKVEPTKPQYDTSEAIFAALLKKHSDKNDEEVANHVWYPACDELFGANNMPANADDLAKLAEKLGL
jgi:hypothetical protein